MKSLRLCTQLIDQNDGMSLSRVQWVSQGQHAIVCHLQQDLNALQLIYSVQCASHDQEGAPCVTFTMQQIELTHSLSPHLYDIVSLVYAKSKL